ncbi:MAG: trigger factor [Planctomycetota bacterium]
MADAAIAEQNETTFDYPTTVEDSGPSAKKISIEVPEDRISSLMSDQLGMFRNEIALPGFRKGKAPAHLIQKKFGNELRKEVLQTVVRESYQQAIEANDLKVLGDPDFGSDDIELPTSGPMKFSFEVEIAPEFDLPDASKATIKKPKVEINEEHVDQAVQNLREQQGTLVPVEDRGVQEKDYIEADVAIKLGDETVTEQKSANLVARAGKIHGIDVPDLADKLAGAKAGETKTFALNAPDNHPSENVRGKELSVEVTVQEIKELELAEINDSFLEELEIADQDELRRELKAEMERRVENDIQQSMRAQMQKYLIDNVSFDVPTKMSDRQADRVVQRRASELMMRGMPAEQIRGNIDKLREGASEAARNELKTFFILSKAAQEHGIQVDENELNGRIAIAAMERGQRPETLKQELQQNGQLQNLYLQMQEQATLDKLLESASVEEVEPEKGEAGDPNKAADEATAHTQDVAPAEGEDVS